MFNLFFILIGGCYVYLLLIYVGKLNGYANLYVLPLAIAGLTMIYLLKYFILKFTGWVTGFKQEADTYIFIVFLINKIVAVCLIPLVVIMAFSDKSWLKCRIDFFADDSIYVTDEIYQII